MAALLSTLTPLIATLKADGYPVIGPARRDDTIVLAELNRADDLPHGWGVTLGAGTDRTRRRDDDLAFGHSAGPQSWKTYLHTPRVPLWTAHRSSGGEDLAISEPPPEDTRYAFVGVRPCDLRPIAIQDRVSVWTVHRLVPGGHRHHRRDQRIGAGGVRQ